MALTNDLIDLRSTFPTLLFDVKYATPDNLSRKSIYVQPYCLLHCDAVPALAKAIELAALAGYRLKIFDAYRPRQAQQRLWDALPDETYVVPPVRGSNHTRGVAIDLTLVNSEGDDVDMGTGFDDMTEQSHPFKAGVSETVYRNRLQLNAIMSVSGFVGIESEWWHFELPGCLDYPLLPAEFECF